MSLLVPQIHSAVAVSKEHVTLAVTVGFPDTYFAVAVPQDMLHFKRPRDTVYCSISHEKCHCNSLVAVTETRFTATVAVPQTHFSAVPETRFTVAVPQTYVTTAVSKKMSL